MERTPTTTSQASHIQTVLPGLTQIVTVAFAPTVAGTFNTNVVFSSNGGASTNPVTGVGVTTGLMSVSPVSWNFGALATGTSTQKTFVVSNSGGTTLSNG